MALRFKYDEAQLRERIAEKKENFSRTIISAMILEGEAFILFSRQNHGYNDQTGNLTSSVGYGVLHNGKLAAEGGFEPAETGTDRAGGQAEGRALLETIIGQYPRGYVLIGVAGMQYAAKVEAMGKDVITGAAIEARAGLIESFERLSKK